MKITDRFNGNILFEDNSNNTKKTLETAIKKYANLRGADLVGANNYNKYKINPLYSMLFSHGPLYMFKLVNYHYEGPYNGGFEIHAGARSHG